jgi:hypothetical protein
VRHDLALDGAGLQQETVTHIRALHRGLRVVAVASFEEKRVVGEGRLRAIPDGWRVLRAILSEARYARRRPTEPAASAEPAEPATELSA